MDTLIYAYIFSCICATLIYVHESFNMNVLTLCL